VARRLQVARDGLIDLHARAAVATVTGVGNDPYGPTILEDGPD